MAAHFLRNQTDRCNFVLAIGAAPFATWSLEPMLHPQVRYRRDSRILARCRLGKGHQREVSEAVRGRILCKLYNIAV